MGQRNGRWTIINTDVAMGASGTVTSGKQKFDTAGRLLFNAKSRLEIEIIDQLQVYLEAGYRSAYRSWDEPGTEENDMPTSPSTVQSNNHEFYSGAGVIFTF